MKQIHMGMLALACLWALAGCGSSGGHGSTTHPLTGIAPAKVHWCDAPTIAFEDDGASPPIILRSWTQAQPLLGFTLVLPPLIPKDACLVSGGGVVRNPIFGSRFSVIYALSTDGALSIAEVPKSQDIPQPQCSAAQASTTAIATCQQTTSGLNVTISSSLPVDGLFETRHHVA